MVITKLVPRKWTQCGLLKDKERIKSLFENNRLQAIYELEMMCDILKGKSFETTALTKKFCEMTYHMEQVLKELKEAGEKNENT